MRGKQDFGSGVGAGNAMECMDPIGWAAFTVRRLGFFEWQ
jgi:hypothetical protein